MSDDTDTDDSNERYNDAEDAFEALSEYTGQAYLTAEDAWYILGEFHKAVEYAFVEENHPYANQIDSADDVMAEDRAMALSMALNDAQKSGTQARGIVSTWPHQMVLTAHHVSEILVNALGGEASDTSYAGSGSTADARHDGNIETLRTLLDDHIAKAGETPTA